MRVVAGLCWAVAFPLGPQIQLHEACSTFNRNPSQNGAFTTEIRQLKKRASVAPWGLKCLALALLVPLYVVCAYVSYVCA